MPKVFLFDEFRLDGKNWTLYRDDDIVELPPKVIDTLIYLVERAGKVVSYEELTRHLWSGVVVESGALRRNISLIRNALDSEQPYRFIQTIKNRGLCFIAPVRVRDEEQLDAGHDDVAASSSSVVDTALVPDGKHRSSYRWSRAVAISLLCVAGLLIVAVCIQSILKKPAYVSKQLTSKSEKSSIVTALLSPTGNMIASADGTWMFLSDAKAIEWHSLTVPGAKGSALNDMEWFPDGIHLLVCSVDPDTKQSAAWSVSVLSGEATLILRDAELAAPSPDGRYIVFMRNDRKELWMADMAGSNVRLIYSDQHLNEMAGPTYFSVDGRYVLLLHSGAHHSEITAHNIVTRESHIVFKSDTQIGGFIPLVNGEILLAQYVNSTPQGDQLLVVKVNMDTGRYSTPTLLESFPTGAISSFSTTSDRRKILVTQSFNRSDVYVASLSNHGNTIDQTRRLTSSHTNEIPAGWIDNETVLMTSDRDGAFNVFSQKLDSNSVTPITTGSLNHLQATLSADRSWLFYMVAGGGKEKPHTTLYRKSLRDGSEQVMYNSSDAMLLLRCAQDSNQCVLAEHTQDECIFYQFDPLKGRGRQLARLMWRIGASAHNWDMSRDGKRIALLESENDVDTISVMDLDHSPMHYSSLKINVPGPPRTLAWDADSSGFYVTTYTEEGTLFNQLHIELDGTTTVLRSEQSSQNGWVIPSPDGKYLAYQKYESVGNIWSLERN